MATDAASLDFYCYSDNSTADHHHQSAGVATLLFVSIVLIVALILLILRLLELALILILRLLEHRQNFDLTTTESVELVNGRRLDTSCPRQESSGYSSQMTVIFRSNHPSVVHGINSNGAWDQEVVPGVSESTRAGGTSTVDERPVVVTPARLNEWVIDLLCISEYRADEGLHDGSSGETTECVICLGEITDGQMVRFLPECCHVFHVQCIDAWLTVHLSCPLCRRAI